jgi:hypothetical protein
VILTTPAGTLANEFCETSVTAAKNNATSKSNFLMILIKEKHRIANYVCQGSGAVSPAQTIALGSRAMFANEPEYVTVSATQGELSR